MFNRTNLLIVALAIASAALGLVLSAWLRPAPIPAYVGAYTTSADAAAIGEKVDDIDLADVDGKSRKLSEWNGKLVVLNFWASWCGPCREEMPMLDRAHAKYSGQGIEVIGVAYEEAIDALGFLKQNPVSYPILINAPDDAVDASLRLGNTQSVLPYTALISRDGHLLKARIGNFSEASFEEWIAPYL